MLQLGRAHALAEDARCDAPLPLLVRGQAGLRRAELARAAVLQPLRELLAELCLESG